MNRKKLRILIMSMAMAMTVNLSSTVFAKVDLNVNSSKGVISVKGTSDHSSEAVTIKAWTGSNEENPEKRYYVDQENTDEQGNFHFNFRVDENKNYHGKVNVGGEIKTFDFSTSAPTIEKTLRQKVEESRDGAANVVWEHNYKKDWAALGLARAGKTVPSDYLSDLEVKFPKITDCETAVIGIVAAGGDPLNFKGQNLIEKVCNGDLEEQGINAVIYGLIAVDTGKYKTPENATWNREKMINFILDNECKPNGGWALWGDKADIDITAMAITALSPYCKSDEKVKVAVDTAVEFLSKNQNGNGGFDSWGSENSESISQVITGLCANGIDPTSEKFTKNGHNPIDALISYKTEDGGFCHVKDERYGGGVINGMSTEQALYALDQYIYFLDKKGSIYAFGDKNSNKEDKVAPIIKTDLQNKTVDEKELIFTVNANDEKDGQVVPVVKLGETVIKIEAGKYKVNLAEGENIITIHATDTDGNKTTNTYIVNYEKTVFTITRVGQGNLQKGNDAELKINIKNNTDKDQKATYLVVLYTSDEQKMVDWTYLNKNIKAGETEQLAGGFTIPKNGEYVVKGMVWESKEEGKAKAKEIKVIVE